jgi:hypothetical protein
MFFLRGKPKMACTIRTLQGQVKDIVDEFSVSGGKWLEVAENRWTLRSETFGPVDTESKSVHPVITKQNAMEMCQVYKDEYEKAMKCVHRAKAIGYVVAKHLNAKLEESKAENEFLRRLMTPAQLEAARAFKRRRINTEQVETLTGGDDEFGAEEDLVCTTPTSPWDDGAESP